MKASKEQIAEMLAGPIHRERIASSMSVPRRCGGCDYINGEQFYRVGGRMVPSDIYHQGREATRFYLEQNP